jgi:hypothetical protein
MTEQHIDDALLAVTNQIFPYPALETQKQWMSKYARKLYKMGAKQFVILMSRISNYIPFFPNATVLLKYSKEELLNILEFAVPPHWRKAFDLRDYLPTSDNKARFIEECERVKQNKAPLEKERDNSNNNRKSKNKISLQNLRKVPQKVARKKIRILVLSIAATARRTLITRSAAGRQKKNARERELSEKNAPSLKRTFCKEVNAIAHRAGKNDDIKIFEKAIKHEQGKHGKKEKKHTKVACAQKVESSDSDSFDESINVMEPGQRIPCKKRYAQRTIQFDSKGNQVNSVLSDLTPGVIKLTLKILIQMMIAKCLLKSDVKNLKRLLIPWTQNPLRRLMKMRTTKQAKRKKPSSSLLTKKRTVKLTLID